MQKVTAAIIVFPITVYRWCISSLFPPCCRYVPTCSDYARDAIRSHGILKGGYLSARRILSCHPWSRRERYDPVPPIQNSAQNTAQNKSQTKIVKCKCSAE